jgi:hypothetical protein
LVFETPDTEEGPGPVILGLGGEGAEGEGTGGAAAISTFVLDDFEDADLKAYDPAGWWYPANDGTGTQLLAVRSSGEISSPTSGGMVLESQVADFSDWGAAFGVDIEDVGPAESGLEVSFSMAANRETEITFHAIDGSDGHFTKVLLINTVWRTTTVRLHELFIFEGDSVRAFDVASATELQWFVSSGSATTFWLDEVIVRFW